MMVYVIDTSIKWFMDFIIRNVSTDIIDSQNAQMFGIVTIELVLAFDNMH